MAALPTTETPYPIVTQEQVRQVCETLDFKQYQLATPGGMVPEPRLNYACGDSKIGYHQYNNVNAHINEWNPVIKAVHDRINHETGLANNACLIIKYRNEHDHIGWHADREVTPPSNSVVTVSVGATRTFCLKRNSDGKELEIDLRSGDAVIMYGGTQITHKHRIKKQSVSAGVRYSLTFRCLTPRLAAS